MEAAAQDRVLLPTPQGSLHGMMIARLLGGVLAVSLRLPALPSPTHLRWVPRLGRALLQSAAGPRPRAALGRAAPGISRRCAAARPAGGPLAVSVFAEMFCISLPSPLWVCDTLSSLRRKAMSTRFNGLSHK